MKPYWRAAFHEAGHSRMGYEYDPASVGQVRIWKEDGGWHGEANVDLAGRTGPERAAIAVAGMLAEARGAANGTHSTPPIMIGQVLFEEVHRVIGVALQNRLGAVHGTIPLSYGPGFIRPPAVLTLEDINYIPDGVLGNEAALNNAITDACRLLNKKSEWGFVIDLAGRLVEARPAWVADPFNVLPH